LKVVISVGGRFHAIQLAEQLDKLGYLEKIITTKSWYVKGILPSRKFTSILTPEYLGMIARMIPALRHRGYYSYIKDNLFDALARKYIPPCDIFHAWGNYALISMPYARKYHAKVIIERGSTHPHFQDEILREECKRFNVNIEKAHPQIIDKGLKEIELADRVIIPSEFVRRSFLEHGVPNEKLSMIPYGINPAHFQQVGKKDDVFRVLFVGNISVQKGVHYLLAAWKKAKLNHAELVFAGHIEDEMKPILAHYEGMFRFAGHVKHEELYTLYSDASVFVLPSLQEGSALVTYEAMACGLPLLVSENTGSIARDAVHGFIIPVRNSDVIAEKLTWYSENEEKARSMGQQGKAYVQEFTWQRYASQVVQVYKQVIGTRVN